MNKHRAARLEALYRLGGTGGQLHVLVRKVKITHRPAKFTERMQIEVSVIDPYNPTRIHETFGIEGEAEAIQLEQMGGLRSMFKAMKAQARATGYDRLLPRVKTLSLEGSISP